MQATAVQPQTSASQVAQDLLTFVGYLMKRTTPDMFRTLGELDLSITQIKMLHSLEPALQDEISLKDLSEGLGLSLAAVSRGIDVLHQRGFVERREDERDRRMKRVKITPSGSAVLARLSEMRLARAEQFLDTLTEAERRKLASALSPIVAREEIAACRPGGLTK